MVIISLFISVIAIVISAISLLGIAIVINTIINPDFNAKAPNSSASNPEDSPEFTKGYTIGSSGVWGAVQLAVYDMFREADIFDFEGTMDNLTKKVSKIISDEHFREKLTNELMDYMSRGENDSYDN